MKTAPLVAAVWFCLGCQAAPSNEAKLEASSQPAVSAASRSPDATLDELDRRRPLPLLPMMALHQKQNMREHLEAVKEIVDAASASDFESVATAAKRLGFSESMGHMCEHMGAGAPGFTEQALSFHHTADGITAAAVKRDSAGVLAALSRTLGACTSCHATYKQKIVTSLPE